jgi:hypothetical protein
MMRTRKNHRASNVGRDPGNFMSEVHKRVSQEIGKHNIVFSNDNFHLVSFGAVVVRLQKQ